MAVTIYHNPKCATSRKMLKAIRETGESPTVIQYLKTPPAREELVALILALDTTPRQILRVHDRMVAKLGLADPRRSDRDLLDAMLDHPSLIERPIVIGPRGTRICRDLESLRAIL